MASSVSKENIEPFEATFPGSDPLFAPSKEIVGVLLENLDEANGQSGARTGDGRISDERQNAYIERRETTIDSTQIEHYKDQSPSKVASSEKVKNDTSCQTKEQDGDAKTQRKNCLQVKRHLQEYSDPEVSKQIDKLCRSLQNIVGKGKLKTSHQLTEAVPQILQMDSQFRAVKTYKDILEGELGVSKRQKVRLTKECESTSLEIQNMKQEIEKLKKTKVDTQLNDFDVITKRGSHEILDTKKSVPVASAAITEEKNTVNVSAYNDLQAECIKLTKQRDQLVKRNHEWDQEYHQIEKTFRSESQKLYQEIIKRDEEIMAGKRLVATLEKEKAEIERLLEQSSAEPQEQKTKLETLQKMYDNERQKCRKYHEYATRLNHQKEKLEGEISRLNEVLSQEKKAEKGPSEGKVRDCCVSKGMENCLTVLHQQVEIFEKDFKEEWRELRELKSKLKNFRDKAHMVRDEEMAQKLHTGGNLDDFVCRGIHEKISAPDHSFRLLSQDRNTGVLSYAGNDQFPNTGPLCSFEPIEVDNVDAAGDNVINKCPRYVHIMLGPEVSIKVH